MCPNDEACVNTVLLLSEAVTSDLWPNCSDFDTALTYFSESSDNGGKKRTGQNLGRIKDKKDNEGIPKPRPVSVSS